MALIKSITKILTMVVSGIAIVVVGGFMMGAVARLWLPKNKNDNKHSSINSVDDKKIE